MSATDSVARAGVTAYQPPEGGPRFLSDVIIELGLAGEAHVNRAVEEARQSGTTVGQILVQDGQLSEDDLARALAARYGLNHIDLNVFEVNPDAANLLPAPAAERYKAVPLAFEPDGSLLVAMADPSDSLALNDISFMTHLEVQAAVAASDLITGLAERLPLPPNESGGSSFPVAASGTPIEPPAQTNGAAPAPTVPAPAPVEAVGTGELDELRAQLEQANSEAEKLRAEVAQARTDLDEERTRHAEMV
ncbi:MAG: hypothetical protein JO244_08010, partial [Solirubrobacterales bacterium]|nr:hypothetical protein [Solirubrobacterales bacterium]